jgi:hypothetical protein
MDQSANAFLIGFFAPICAVLAVLALIAIVFWLHILIIMVGNQFEKVGRYFSSRKSQREYKKARGW